MKWQTLDTVKNIFVKNVAAVERAVERLFARRLYIEMFPKASDGF